MSKEDRASLVQQLKEDQANRQQSLLDIVNKTLGQQAEKFTLLVFFCRTRHLYPTIGLPLIKLAEPSLGVPESLHCANPFLRYNNSFLAKGLAALPP